MLSFFNKSSKEIWESAIRDHMIKDLNARNKEDMISTLPDELLHHIFSFIDSNFAVQTCVLSKRWVNLWSTLPFLNFEPRHFDQDGVYYRNFVTDLIFNRNQQSDTSSIKIDFRGFDEYVTRMIIDYAVSHNVQKFMISRAKIDSCLSFPLVKSLHLSHCKAPILKWNLPSLTSLHLESVTIGEKLVSFEGFNHLKKLTLIDCCEFADVEVVTMNAPNLTSLTIAHNYRPLSCMFLVSAPNLLFFSFQGKFVPMLSVVDGFPSLNKVKLEIHMDKYELKKYNSEEKKNQATKKLITLFHELRRTKCLTLSLMTMQVLSGLLLFSECQTSPFGNLKSINLQHSFSTFGYLKSINLQHSSWQSDCAANIPDQVIKYLLSSSPCAKIFVEDYFKGIINYDPKKKIFVPVKKVKAATPSSTKIVASNEVPKPEVKKKRNSLPQCQQAMSNVQGNGDGIHKGLGVIPRAVVRGALNDKNSSDKDSFSLWEGHRIYSEYVDLLTRIKEKHPETSEHFAPQTDIIYTTGLNTLCSIVQAFSEDCRSKFTAADIARYKGLFSDLDKWGFNTTWLVDCLSNTDGLSFLSKSR